MTGSKVQRWGLRLGGSLVLAIGIGHVFMPRWGYSPDVTTGMSAPAEAHFFYLGTYAIGSFLLAFGGLALVLSRSPTTAATNTFSLVMALVWVSRFVLEIVFPVEVPIFGLERPHPVLATTILVIAGSFVIAAAAGWRRDEELVSPPRSVGA